jgi:hypothetical protein
MLCLAVVLATVAAFGLHPEPVDEARNAGVQVSQTESVRSGAHLCVACLTHATSLAAPFAAVLLAPADVSHAALLPAVAPPPRLSRTPCSGLSPPSHS